MSVHQHISQNDYTHGPWRCHTRQAGPWTVTACEFVTEAAETKWDVYAVHETGVRVPPGPNVHSEWSTEFDRLERVVG